MYISPQLERTQRSWNYWYWHFGAFDSGFGALCAVCNVHLHWEPVIWIYLQLSLRNWIYCDNAVRWERMVTTLVVNAALKWHRNHDKLRQNAGVSLTLIIGMLLLAVPITPVTKFLIYIMHKWAIEVLTVRRHSHLSSRTHASRSWHRTASRKPFDRA